MTNDRKREKFVYKVPVKVKGENNIVLERELTVVADNKRRAIGRVKKDAKNAFLKLFPTHSLDSIEIDVDNIKVVCKRVVEKNKNSKPRPRSLFPRNSELNFVGEKKYQVGDRVISHKVVQYGEIYCELLPNEEASVLYHKDAQWFIIKGYEGYEKKKLIYVKILTENANGDRVLIRWELENGKLVSMVEFLYGSSYTTWISKEKFLKTKNIARNLLNKNLLNQEGGKK